MGSHHLSMTDVVHLERVVFYERENQYWAWLKGVFQQDNDDDFWVLCEIPKTHQSLFLHLKDILRDAKVTLKLSVTDITLDHGHRDPILLEGRVARVDWVWIEYQPD